MQLLLSPIASFWVCLGAAIGAWMRMLIISWFAVVMPGTTLGMMCVNIIGSFFIGVVYIPLGQASFWLKSFCIGGLLGSLTTFSTYALDVFILLERQQYNHAMIVGIVTPVACVFFVYIGYCLFQHIFIS